MRWILTHERYGRRFSDLLTRRVDPRQLFVPSVLLPAAAGGAWNRLRARLSSGTDPTDPLEVG